MNKKKTMKVGGNDITVSDEIYTASRAEMERVHKKNQRLRKDKLDYKIAYLSELYNESEYEPEGNYNVEDDAFRKYLSRAVVESC
jgi:hypothetical protein